MVRSRLSSVQLLRGLAAISVVIYHLMAVEKKYSPQFLSIPDFFRIGQAGVDLFFVISGFIMAYISYNNWGKAGSWRFLLKRAARIFPVYWFYSLVTFFVLVLMPSWVNSSQGNQFSVLGTVFLLPSDKLPLVMVAWSLVFEVFFYAVFSVLIRFKRNIVFSLLSVWAGALVVCNLGPVSVSNNLVSFYTSPLTLEFIIGIVAFVVLIHLPKTKSIFTPIAVLILAFLVASWLFFFPFEHRLLQVCSLGVSLAFFVLALVYLEEHFDLKIPKSLIDIGDASYSIYLSHVLVINGVVKVLSVYFYSSHSLVLSWLLVCIAIFVVVIVSTISYRYLERAPYGFLLRQINSLRWLR